MQSKGTYPAEVPADRSGSYAAAYCIHAASRAAGHAALTETRKFRRKRSKAWLMGERTGLAKRGETRIDYGLLPPRFFDRFIEKFKELRSKGKVAGTSRDEPAAAAKG